MISIRETINKALWNLISGIKESVVTEVQQALKQSDIGKKLTDDDIKRITSIVVTCVDVTYNKAAGSFDRSVKAALGAK